MTNFSIGTSGSTASKANTIPDGTPLRIESAVIEKSKFTQVIQRGPNAGTEQPKYQLKVVLETLGAGRTTDGKTFKAGDRYSQYLGGVYVNDQGGVKITEEGGAGGFLASLQKAGLKLPADLEGLVGVEFVAKGREGGAGKLAYRHIHAGSISPKVSTVAPKAAAEPTTAAATVNAFTALSQEHQDTILEAVKAGDTVTAEDVVGAGIAADVKAAEAILAAVPKVSAGGKLGRSK